MRNIRIVDMTLRENEHQRGAELTFREKLEVAKLLEKLRVDVIETGYVDETQAATVTIRTLADTLKYSTLCCPVPLDKAAIDRTWDALNQAKSPRLNLIVPTSVVQMEYSYQLKPAKMMSNAAELAAYCVSLAPQVEFTAEDATRSEPEFLAGLLRAAVAAGVKIITLTDSAGMMLPNEAAAFIADLRRNVPELADVTLSLHFKNNLSLAVANALISIEAGVDQLKTTLDGAEVNGGSLSLEKFVHALNIRHDSLGVTLGLNTAALQHICKQLEQLIQVNQSGRTSFSHISGPMGQSSEQIELNADADLITVRRKVLAMGYDLAENDIEAVYEQFCQLAAKKKVFDRDIEALIAETSRQVAPTYRLLNYVINSGSAITATAFVSVDKNGQMLQGVSLGDGPIDAAFLAFEQILGHHFDLEDFQIQAVTEGREALGDALVKLRYDGKLYSGRGLSTDIISASIRAYLNAVNKIVYEEKFAI